MGKKENKSGPGRALVKQHNQAMQLAKEKGRWRNKPAVLESITDVKDIDAVIEQAEESDRIFSVDHPVPNLIINLDLKSGLSDLTPEEKREQIEEEDLYRSSLQVPRRPPWNARMSVEELDANERHAFLGWRRSIARLEENEKLILTPFEKNLDIWRQLWRVLERSDLLVMVVDARDPLFYRCLDLEAYAREIDEHKRTLLLVNKADLLPLTVRQKWAEYFHSHEILFIFWSARVASAALEGRKLSGIWEKEDGEKDSRIYGRDELLARLQHEAEAIVLTRRHSGCNSNRPSQTQTQSLDGCSRDMGSKQVVVGFVGYPNVGKSSTINALVGEKRTGVTSTPGKTKHFQTLIVSDELMLCDCPGLVFPSFSSSRYEMVASGVLPIDRMTEHRDVVQVVANRVPRDILEDVYNISLPKPKAYEPQSRPPLASELLRAYCSSRGHVGSSGLPDETSSARQILKDYIDGKLPHFEMPPGMSKEDGEEDGDRDGLAGSGSSTNFQLDFSAVNDQRSSSVAADGVGGTSLEQVLNDLDTFDSSNDLNSAAAVRKKSSSGSSHKHHKKPQKKKDRSWRVGNDGEDGMPVVRVFQKQVNLRPVRTY